jgi:hypothetical protein
VSEQCLVREKSKELWYSTASLSERAEPTHVITNHEAAVGFVNSASS